MRRMITTVHTRHLGFTLGEMLVVLAVFSILASLFFFSSQDALTRTRYSVVLQDQGYLMQGLNEYEALRNGLPSQAEGLLALARETGSHRVIPSDPFAQNAIHSRRYEFLRDLSSRHLAVVISVGPDGDSDLAEALESQGGYGLSTAGTRASGTYRMAPEAAHAFLARYSYDPTNGSASDGDIISVYLK